MKSYVHGASCTPLLGETIGANLDRTTGRFPNRDAFVSLHQGIRQNYSQFHATVEEIARSLLALEIEPRERVGIWSPNRIEWAIVQYAAAKIGAILVNVNPAYKTSELVYVLKQSGMTTLIHAPEFRNADYIEMVDEARKESHALKTTVIFESLNGRSQGQQERGPGSSGRFTWDGLRDLAAKTTVDQLRARENSLQFDDPINIQYTSGTTGFPKGATLSHHNSLNNGYFVQEICRCSESDRICVPVPLYHCFGMVMGNLGATSRGACAVYPAEAFDAQATLRAVETERCTSLFGVPTMFIAQLDSPKFEDYNLSSLRTGIMGGSPCPIEVMRRVQTEMHMPEVTICYGMTETSPVSFQSATDDPVEKRVSTIGRIHPHAESKIVDPVTRQTVARGETGEICTRGYLVMLGYWGNDEATRSAIDQARWMHTGDLGIMDDEGYVRIVGRIKDMVIRGGENIYPREVEEFIYKHEMVTDVQVIGVPDAKYGEELCVWVRLKDGCACSGDQLREWCKGKIATYKIPRYWKITDSFPMTVTGKIQKFKMREISVEELGLISDKR